MSLPAWGTKTCKWRDASGELQSASSHLNASRTCQWRHSVSQQHSTMKLLNAYIVCIFSKANMTGPISCRKLKQTRHQSHDAQSKDDANWMLCNQHLRFVDMTMLLHKERTQNTSHNPTSMSYTFLCKMKNDISCHDHNMYKTSVKTSAGPK